MGWYKTPPPEEFTCFFLNVMDYNYLVFLYFGTIITPALVMAAFYAHIYQVVIKQLRQIVTMNPEKGSSSKRSVCSGGTMVRVLGKAQSNEVKATQNLAIIVLFFMICWIPLYTINCVIAFSKNKLEINTKLMLCTIILSHLNSAGNPILYAYNLRDFRAALRNFLYSLFSKKHIYKKRFNTNFNTQMKKVSRKGCLSSSLDQGFDDSRVYYNSRILNHHLAPKISTIAKNSAVVAAVTAGDVNHRQIWNIVEGSASSSDSLKDIESFKHDKMLMVRPATPFRAQRLREFNQGYSEACVEDFDDVFFEDTLPYHDYNLEDTELETSLTERRSIKVQPAVTRTKCLSSSSPQLSRNMFVVEATNNSLHERSSSLIVQNALQTDRSFDSECNCSPVKNFKIGAFNVKNIFRNSNRPISKSLSDDGNTSLESITKDSNGIIYRGSYGS